MEGRGVMAGEKARRDVSVQNEGVAPSVAFCHIDKLTNCSHRST